MKRWPHRQPWRIVRGTTVLLDPDTRRPLDLQDASHAQLDRTWTALDTWATHHNQTLIADVARQHQQTIEAEAARRRAAAAPRPMEAAA